MLDGIDKKALVLAIRGVLAGELAAVREAANAAKEGATHEDAKPENQYDTRALEASYLAGAQAARAEVLDASLHTLDQLDLRVFSDDDAITLSAIVEIEHDDGTDLYFVCPVGGGVKIAHEAGLIRVLTPESPLGQRLVKKRVGDDFVLKIKGVARDYEIVGVQ